MASKPRKRQPATPAVLKIEGEMTVFRAAELLPQLAAEPAPQAVDLSGVTEFDCAGVQLLVLAHSRAVPLLAPSAAVTEVLELLKLDALLGTGQPALRSLP